MNETDKKLTLGIFNATTHIAGRIYEVDPGSVIITLVTLVRLARYEYVIARHVHNNT